MTLYHKPVLEAMGTLVEALVPESPAVPIGRAFVYPYQIPHFERLPVLIVSMDMLAAPAIQDGVIGCGEHRWTIDVMIVLAAGAIDSPEKIAPFEWQAQAWLPTLYDTIRANHELTDTVIESSLSTYYIGRMLWGTTKTYGIRATVPVMQEI